MLHLQYRVALLFIGFVLLNVHAKVQDLRVLQQSDFSECKSNLLLADQDMDEEVTADEWITFVRIQSEGSIQANFYRELPLPFILLFTSTSCTCLEREGPDSDCCLRDNAHIDLKTIDLQDGSQSYFFRICTRMELMLHYMLLTNSPQAAMVPSIAPTVDPIVPTSLRSISPTAAISEYPSSAPTISEFFEMVFTYGIVLDNFLSAEDILQGKNNTVRETLLHAEKQILVRILNETYPCVSTMSHRRTMEEKLEIDNTIYKSTPSFAEKDRNDTHKTIKTSNRHSSVESPSLNLTTNLRSRTTVGLVVPSKISSTKKERRQEQKHDPDTSFFCSVFYTDDVPIKMIQAQNNDCDESAPDPINNSCVILTSVVTVIIPSRDMDRSEVRDDIIHGFRQSFDDGSFIELLQ